jgi:predicted adenylyl cyclase CyaB
MRNIEIKYRVQSLDVIYRCLLNLPEVEEKWIREQKDVYFQCKTGRLKMRIEPGQKGQLIYYRRADSGQARESNYFIYYAEDPELLQQILMLANDLLVSVEKERLLLMFRNVRIHLDRVRELGEFLEFESVVSKDFPEVVAIQNLKEIQKILAEYLSEAVPESYSDLLLRKAGKAE